MAQSYVTFTGNGSSTGPITLGFNYILKAHVKVYEGRDILANTGTLKSETTHYTFNTAGTQISMVTAPANGVIITIERQTPNDDQIVPYADGSNLIADSLNNSDKQTLFCTQELEDRQELSAAKADAAKTASDTATSNVTTLTGTQFRSDGSQAMTGNLNAGNNKVINVTDPTNAQDAVTKAYLERSGSIASAQILDGTIVDGDVNASAAISGSKLQASSGSNAGSMSSAHYTKIEGIEASATADQSATEIKSSYESNSDTNAYTDAEKTKLSGIETSATADQSASEIKSSYESNSNTNAFTDANKTLVDAISATATEINYTTNVTSDIQSQINNKQPLDSELTTLAGMTSATASKLAASTNLTSDIADLNQIDGLTKQTTISDSDASFPTSGAVVDYVAAQISPLGGLEVVATEVAFPNTQPASGVVISISDAGGVVINGSGVSTTGRTVGGATITINGFPSSLQGETLVAGVGLMVSSTGSSQTYNYHKILGKEDDIKQLSDDINDFNARYRVGSSNPSSALDAGDLFFNTSTSKLLVYNATNTAWEEAQSIGNFYISTLSPAFNGSLQDFTITNAPTNAEQILLSINGVIQKPNAGTSTPSEGFALSGSTVKLGAAPASTDTYFAVVIGSTVNIGTPSNNTVSTAILQNGSVTTDKLGGDCVDGNKIADDAVGAEHIEDLDNDVKFIDAKGVVLGTGSDTKLSFNGTHTGLDCGTGNFNIDLNGASSSETSAKFIQNGAVELYWNDALRVSTSQTGAVIKDTADTSVHLQLEASTGVAGSIVASSSNEEIGFADDQGHWLLYGVKDGAVSLYYDNSVKLATSADGTSLTGNATVAGVVAPSANATYNLGYNSQRWNDIYMKNDMFINEAGRICWGDGNELQIYHNGVSSYLDNNKNHLYLRNNVDGDDGGNIYLQAKSGEQSIICSDDQGVGLYFDNALKFETSSSGASVLGSLYCSDHINLTNDGKYIAFGDSSDLKIWHTSTNSLIKHEGNGNLYMDSYNAHIYIRAGDGNTSVENSIVCNNNAGVDVYHSGSKVFETLGNGVRVQGGIMFGSDTADANRITDYEEGSWTPDFFYHSSVSNVYGHYTKIGRMVYAYFTGVVYSAASDTQYISNLPFTTANIGGGVGGVARGYQNFDIQDGPIYYVENNSTQMTFYKDNGSPMPASDCNGHSFRGMVVYTAAS